MISFALTKDVVVLGQLSIPDFLIECIPRGSVKVNLETCRMDLLVYLCEEKGERERERERERGERVCYNTKSSSV